MKINKELLIASINVILMTALIAFAVSCANQSKMTNNYYKNYKTCQAYE